MSIPKINLKAHYEYLRLTYNQTTAIAALSELCKLPKTTLYNYLAPRNKALLDKTETRISKDVMAEWMMANPTKNFNAYCSHAQENNEAMYY